MWQMEGFEGAGLSSLFLSPDEWQGGSNMVELGSPTAKDTYRAV
jgi:hypothetical protein